MKEKVVTTHQLMASLDTLQSKAHILAKMVFQKNDIKFESFEAGYLEGIRDGITIIQNLMSIAQNAETANESD